MSERVCTYKGNREETLVAYLYDDIAPAERSIFESHVLTCAVCSMELAGLGLVREQLEQWAPPEPVHALGQPAAVPQVSRGASAWTTLRDVPAWMQIAAAVLFLGAAAGAANLDIKYGREGLSVHTGWLRSPTREPADTAKPVAAAVPASAAEAPVTRAELAALEEQLRSEIGTAAAASPNIVRQVRVLLADSERRQQNELALRLAATFQDFQAQRQADLTKIDRTLRTAGYEIQRQQGKVDSLAIKVSQRQ